MDQYSNEYLTSYRVRNGVLHNPRSDRRTTSGTFHVCEGGLPIPGDKKAVPRPVFVAGWVFMGAVLAVAAIGRVYTGEHWPSDVLAGLLLGAGWTLLGLSLRPLSDPVLDA